jgi:hypothetical protein
MNAMLLGAMCTAIEHPIRFHAVTDHPAAAVSTRRRKGVDGTLETIEHMGFAAPPNFKAFIVYIAANFTSHCLIICHSVLSFLYLYLFTKIFISRDARLAPS